jgi:hypothetical protein
VKKYLLIILLVDFALLISSDRAERVDDVRATQKSSDDKISGARINKDSSGDEEKIPGHHQRNDARNDYELFLSNIAVVIPGDKTK